MNAWKHYWVGIRGKNSNTQLFMDFSNYLIII